LPRKILEQFRNIAMQSGFFMSRAVLLLWSIVASHSCTFGIQSSKLRALSYALWTKYTSPKLAAKGS